MNSLYLIPCVTKSAFFILFFDWTSMVIITKYRQRFDRISKYHGSVFESYTHDKLTRVCFNRRFSWIEREQSRDADSSSCQSLTKCLRLFFLDSRRPPGILHRWNTYRSSWSDEILSVLTVIVELERKEPKPEGEEFGGEEKTSIDRTSPQETFRCGLYRARL